MWTKAAEQGNAYAQNNLGVMYVKGEGVEQDFTKAIELWTKAAEQGNAYAQNNLGVMYVKGEGVEQDFTKAIELWTKAAEQGNAGAQCNLGIMYYHGERVKQDFEKAFDLYTKAAVQGFPYAMGNLGEMYWKGNGVCEDKEAAFQWLLKAVEAIEKDDRYRDYGEPFYYIGEYWFEKGEDKADSAKPDKPNTNEQQHCYRQAEKYYQKAIDYGYNCLYALEKVQRRLNKKIKGEVMERYGRELVGLKLSPPKLFDRIEEDLKKDFGDNWEELLSNTRAALKSGIYIYVNLIALGKDFYSQLDFSSVVSTLAKSLEIELGRFFHKEYIRWLKKHDISPDVFNEDQRSIVYVKDDSWYYRDEKNSAAFSLGGFAYLVDKKRASQPLMQRSDLSGKDEEVRYEAVIDPRIAAYADELFKETAFIAENREKEIKNYLISLSEDVESIRDKRNPAAHSCTMKKSDAELCGDYLVKVRKLLCGLLKKIKPEYKTLQ